MVKPGGLMIAATLNRTLKSFALAIVGAEYVLRWLPRGTHQWDKFVTPHELERAFEKAGLDVTGERGVIYNLLADRWQLSSDMDVNYMLVARAVDGEGKRMILELVEFNSPKGWTREQVAEDARHVIPKWQANKELLRKHFLLELNGKTGAGVYIWPSVEAAKRAHDEDWRQSMIKRTGGCADHPLFRPVPADRQRERQGQRIPGSGGDQASRRLKRRCVARGTPCIAAQSGPGLSRPSAP